MTELIRQFRTDTKMCMKGKAVKQVIMMNLIQNKRFCLHNICACSVYIYYKYVNTNICMYIFKKNVLRLYIKHTVTSD